MEFTHLHVHSEYSLLDGLIKIPDLIEKIKSYEMKSVALTDHGAMYGTFHFYIACQEAEIKPIIGVEIYKAKNSRFDRKESIRDHSHLTLIAYNNVGYKNLIKLVTKAHLEGFFYKPRIDFDLLEKYNEGIIVLSGCLNSEISQACLRNQTEEAELLVSKYKEIFDKNFYLEIQRIHGIIESEIVCKKLVSLSRKFDIPIVATTDVHYLEKEDAYAQEILLCIQTQSIIHEKDRPLSMYKTPEFYLKSPTEMQGLFIDLPDSIINTQIISDKCNVEIPYGKWILPKYPIPKGQTADSYLEKLTFEKGEKRITIDFKARERILYELSVIKKKGYSTYFLIVQDFVNWAKESGIAVGPGRGSAAGSLVAFCLGITDINPLVYNLPFERFLNPDRPSPPDFDIDFADTRRDEVLSYVIDKYGENKVAQIITFGRMEARLAVRDTARALGYSYSEGDRIAKMIPLGKQGFAMTIDKALEESPQLKFAYNNETDVKKILDIAKKIEGIARHTSVHPAGVVIADKDLTEYVPLQKETKGERIITQYDMYSIDLNAVSDNKAIGLLKADFLGLRNLTIIENSIKFVENLYNKKIDIHEIPLNDKKTFELISKGLTIGVFQMESRGMRKLAQELQPNKISDLAAMVALYRPGPMDLIPQFLENKKNPSKIKYLHKDLKNVLSETYGILVYQEQVMEIAKQLAGYSMAEADNLRLAVGKKKKNLMETEKVKFIKRCIEKGYSKDIAEKLFGFIEKFASYGFNKPHSASYALISYWTAYMKANYTICFMTALLSAELQGAAGTSKEAKVYQAIEDCKYFGITVLPPDINESEYDFSIEKNAIRFGLSAIKNVGSSAIESILTARKKKKFTGLKDFLLRVDTRKVNKKTVESLIKAGAFDSFGTRAGLLLYYPICLKEITSKKIIEHNVQAQLFKDLNDLNIVDDKNICQKDEFSELELIALEKEVIGFPIGRNPLSQYKRIVKNKTTIKIGELAESELGKINIIAGIISSVKKITSKNNSLMAFLTIYDETGSIEAVVFPKVFERTKKILLEGQALLIKGKTEQRGNEISFVVEDAISLSKFD